MWPFLLLLALVPLFFYWSSSIGDLFPSLAHYFPDKNASTQVAVYDGVSPEGNPTAGAPNKWFTSSTESGYVAWAISGAGTYRLAVGCHTGSPATLQVTPVVEASVPAELVLNYQFGEVPLTDGYFLGDELVGVVAQLGDVYLQDSSTAVIAQFTVPKLESNAIARELTYICGNPASGS